MACHQGPLRAAAPQEMACAGSSPTRWTCRRLVQRRSRRGRRKDIGGQGCAMSTLRPPCFVQERLKRQPGTPPNRRQRKLSGRPAFLCTIHK